MKKIKLLLTTLLFSFGMTTHVLAASKPYPWVGPLAMAFVAIIIVIINWKNL